jgi:hypothetical protein
LSVFSVFSVFSVSFRLFWIVPLFPPSGHTLCQAQVFCNEHLRKKGGGVPPRLLDDDYSISEVGFAGISFLREPLQEV